MGCRALVQVTVTLHKASRSDKLGLSLAEDESGRVVLQVQRGQRLIHPPVPLPLAASRPHFP